MPRPGLRRAAPRLAAISVVLVALAACGEPADFDTDQQVAYARACASLIERGLSDDKPPRVATLDNKDLNLDDPAGFYSTLEDIRGPSDFNLHDPAQASETARKPLDKCDTKKKVLSSLFSTTTTTTTTVPGS